MQVIRTEETKTRSRAGNSTVDAIADSQNACFTFWKFISDRIPDNSPCLRVWGLVDGQRSSSPWFGDRAPLGPAKRHADWICELQFCHVHELWANARITRWTEQVKASPIGPRNS